MSILRRVINRLCYETLGFRPIALKAQADTDAGTIQALAHLIPETKLDPFSFKETSDTQELEELFIRYGSDKSIKHNYHLLYASILNRKSCLTILEIGLGTNNTTIPSNMGPNGKPGASLRAFRDWAPQSLVFGADVDHDILFTEDRIATYFVDQTNSASLAELALQLPIKEFDLIIDDGLHTPWANLNTLRFALPLLKRNGYFVVEDILHQYLPVWKTVLALVPNSRLMEAKSEIVFIVQIV